MPTKEAETEASDDLQADGVPPDQEVEQVHADAPVDRDAGERIERIIESVLFAAGAPVSLRKLVEVLGASGPRPSSKEVETALRSLQESYVAEQRGIRLYEVAGGYQVRTARENAEWVRQLFREKPARLGRATLETLAIVAYKQPVTRVEIEAIRGVDVDGVLNTLLARKLIMIAGRKEAVGRPLLYGTTPEFLETFGLKALDELPTLHELGPIPDGEASASPIEEPAGTPAAAAAAESAGHEAVTPDLVAAAGNVAGAAAGGPGAGTIAEDPGAGGGCVAAHGRDDNCGGADPGERPDSDGTGGEGGPPPRPDHD